MFPLSIENKYFIENKGIPLSFRVFAISHDAQESLLVGIEDHRFDQVKRVGK